MWIPEKFEVKPQKMDFSSSGQGTVNVTVLYADGEKLMNAIELIELNADPIQLHVCDHCGYPGCSSGEWVSIRRIGQSVLLIPPFMFMDEGEWEASEYDPPYFTREKGSILMRGEKYEELRGFVNNLPIIGEIKKVSPYETCRILQWEAPFKIFGDYPNPVSFKKDLLCTTSFPNDEVAVNELMSLMNSLQSNKIDIDLVPISREGEKISFFLEGSEFIEWAPMIKDIKGFRLIFGHVFSIADIDQQ